MIFIESKISEIWMPTVLSISEFQTHHPPKNLPSISLQLFHSPVSNCLKGYKRISTKLWDVFSPLDFSETESARKNLKPFRFSKFKLNSFQKELLVIFLQSLNEEFSTCKRVFITEISGVDLCKYILIYRTSRELPSALTSLDSETLVYPKPTAYSFCQCNFGRVF